MNIHELEDANSAIRTYKGIAIFGVAFICVAALVQHLFGMWFLAILIVVIYLGWVFLVFREREHVNFRHDERTSAEVERSIAESKERIARADQIIARLESMADQAQRLPAPSGDRVDLIEPVAHDGHEWTEINPHTFVRYDQREINRVAMTALSVLPPMGLKPSQSHIGKHCNVVSGGMIHAAQLLLQDWGYVRQPRVGADYEWTEKVIENNTSVPPLPRTRTR